MRVLLLSGYDAPSHRRWRQSLVQLLPHWQWTVLHQPPRHFKWRMRGGGFLWAYRDASTLQQSYDAVVATSMVDLATLRGLVPSLAAVPTLVYFHENQFAYPQRHHQRADVEPQLINLYSALSADRIAFNSAYNRDSFLSGAEALFHQLPDAIPPQVLTQLRERSEVLPVPVEAGCFVQNRAARDGRLSLVWNHRWEYDKAPDRLLKGLQCFFDRCGDSEPAITVHVVGQQFREQPPVFDALKALLTQQGALGQWGYVHSQSEYRQRLADSHVVLSTALHDFQGLSVLEAVAAGCRPIVPARQAYPEWFPPAFCYRSHEEHPEREAEAFADALLECYCQFRETRRMSVPDIRFLHEAKWRDAYQNVITGMVRETKMREAKK
ncbi:tRNA-queuosine alpha-mannosyltransferase domain-containing protein [Marinimicrobium sp. ARAG 43.8]|uniref:tRNA-queuosine alpha-mannosyltransferase domain-containing protein n=1 Tax=Marinimicrobium sp. ARAG 43.8 TaxID=3418719 RepID=UPI003CF4093A